MNEKALRILEYPKIIHMLADAASTIPGKELCEKLVPTDNITEIRQRQQETTDAENRLFRKGSVSFAGVTDIRPSVMRLEVGSSLGAGELLQIRALLSVCARAKNYGKSEEETSDSLSGLFNGLEPLAPLYQEIDRCILSENEIADDASPGLRQVRRSIRSSEERVHSLMNELLNSSRNYLQDAVITMRDGRYCLPVRQEYRGQVNGLVHDQSSSGSTVFIEPMAVVRLNNDIRELEIREQKEIEAVLADLSNQCAGHTEAIGDDYHILVNLDFIFAKASLSRQYKGSEPVFNEEGKIRIKRGRHPLLQADRVVPIDISLGEDFDQLIITGPNTGGKTVSLKTVGLLSLMGQAGLHIPAFDSSSLSVFHEIYADIGDEQSIEQNLSTFSSHMTNIVTILAHADEKSLVLFDELGAGTDPTEGAALAESILSYLHGRSIRTMATTHYSELKVYALTTDGVENACCEFDVETLRPTYRLLIGIPGKSNAFAISMKLGLPDFLIEDAKSRLDESTVHFEDLLTSLEQSRVAIEKQQQETETLRKEAEELKKQAEEKQEKLDRQKNEIIRRANEDARKTIQEAKDYADETIRVITRKISDRNLSRELEAERTKLREKLNASDRMLSRGSEKKTGTARAEELHVGSYVRIISMNLNGIVQTMPSQKGELYVRIGALHTCVKLQDLEILETPQDPQDPQESKTGAAVKSSGSGIGAQKSFSISPEINLIGKTVDEALSLLDKYLDDAYLAHLPQVRIIHGRGTGALRAGIWQYLRKQKYIKTYREGEFSEGGIGATIVEFK